MLKGKLTIGPALDPSQMLCNDIFKYGPSDLKDAKPSANDIDSSFELAKEGYDLELNYKGFEKALQMLAFKIYKKQPSAKYKTDMAHHGGRNLVSIRSKH
eukprot:82455_1